MGNRSIWKGPYVQKSLLKKSNRALKKGKFSVIRTWSRSSVIIPSFTGLTFAVHNGKRFTNVFVNEQMIGKKLGEFSFSRTFHGHNKLNKTN